jgi:hypothetical protein
MTTEFKIGGFYNWKHQPERLIYLGYNFSGNGHWHQFALVDKPKVVWCEVLPADLQMLEETTVQAEAEQSAKMEPVDLKRCQAEKSNGVNAFTLGGKREMVRCKAKPKFVATEAKEDAKGIKGKMSLCAGCKAILIKLAGADYATFEPSKGYKP